MTLGILGKKLGMTQLFQDDGTCIPVTVVQAGPCKVLQVKMAAAAEHPGDSPATQNLGKRRGKVARPRRADGYYAVQLGFDDKPTRSARGIPSSTPACCSRSTRTWSRSACSTTACIAPSARARPAST